jgi:hypothetical protein
MSSTNPIAIKKNSEIELGSSSWNQGSLLFGVPPSDTHARICWLDVEIHLLCAPAVLFPAPLNVIDLAKNCLRDSYPAKTTERRMAQQRSMRNEHMLFFWTSRRDIIHSIHSYLCVNWRPFCPWTVWLVRNRRSHRASWLAIVSFVCDWCEVLMLGGCG